jgi:hypothetical protein
VRSVDGRGDAEGGADTLVVSLSVPSAPASL